MSNTLWSAAEAVKVTEGTTTKEWVATGLSMDSRSVKKGDLFIAIRGDVVDGHKYVVDALKNGAVAAVVDYRPEGVSDDAALLLVEDTLQAMRDLGQGARHRTAAKIIGITGTVGKTSSKEMMAVALEANGQAHASEGSYNNHWGVPFSLASMNAGADYGIFEMGMNHSGEITPLTQQVKPEIAIITTVTPVHMEFFNDLQEVAEAKAEIFKGMDHNGIVILNADNEFFPFLKAKAQTQGVKEVLSFGESEIADARLLDCLEAANGTRVKADIDGEIVQMSLQMSGKHFAINALSVLLAVKKSGADVQKAAKAIAKMQPPSGRGRREYLDLGVKDNPVTLIDETFNASPEAMKAAFRVLAMIDPGRGGRRIAVLGDMLEMGNKGAQMHADLAMPLKAAGIDLVYTCGTLMKNLYDKLPKEQQGVHRASSKELAQIVPEVLVPGDVVMVKGSKGSKMDVVVEAMRELPSTINLNASKTQEI